MYHCMASNKIKCMKNLPPIRAFIQFLRICYDPFGKLGSAWEYDISTNHFFGEKIYLISRTSELGLYIDTLLSMYVRVHSFIDCMGRLLYEKSFKKNYTKFQTFRSK